MLALLLLAGCGQPSAKDGDNAAAGADTAMVDLPVETVAPETDSDADLNLPPDQTTPAEQAELEAAAAKAGLPVTKQSRTRFSCDNGETIEVRFFPDQGIAVLVRGGENVELNREPVDEGFKYTNGQTSITGDKSTINLQVGMMAATACKPV